MAYFQYKRCIFLSTYELEQGRHVARLHRRRVVVIVVRTRPRAIPLAMIHVRKSIHGFPLVPLYGYEAPLAEGRRSAAIKLGSLTKKVVPAPQKRKSTLNYL